MKLIKRTAAVFVVLMMLLESIPTLAAVRNVKDTTSIPGWTMEVSNIDGGGYID